MKSKLFVVLLLTVGLIFSVVGAASAEGTLVFGSSGDAVRLDPADVTDGESIQRMDNI
ncbi:unnamed protein product, partial [marine sediment metagenome]